MAPCVWSAQETEGVKLSPLFKTQNKKLKTAKNEVNSVFGDNSMMNLGLFKNKVRVINNPEKHLEKNKKSK